MSRSDQWVVLISIVVIIVYVSVLIFGLITHRLSYFLTVLNLVSALAIILYWTQKQIRIQQHIFEWREVLVLISEASLLILSVYSLVGHHWDNPLIKILQYIVFGIHLLALLLFATFLLTFKLKKLT